MRIAMVSWESLHSFAVGGVAAHVTELAAALERRGHDVHVFTRRPPGRKGHDCVDGVHYHRVAYAPHHEFVDDVNNMCRAMVDRFFDVEDYVGHFDVVHAHDWLTANAMIWIKQGRGHRCVFTVHATEYARCGNCFHNGRSHRIRDQERAGTYWADRVIAVSHATRKEIAWMYEVPEWKTSVVYNGVSPHRFGGGGDAGALKHRYGIGPMDPTVLFCGRLTHQKGPDLLVEAIPPVLRHFPRAKFVFAGDGDMRGHLEGRARHVGAGDAVRFLGYRSGEELVELFKLADAVCVPSRNEPFGIVVLEGWSASKPVVVTQNGGPDEYVQHDVNGLKIRPQVDSVAWGLGTLFGNFDHARWMGSNGRRMVEEQFTWDRIAAQTLDVYDPQWSSRSLPQVAPPAPQPALAEAPQPAEPAAPVETAAAPQDSPPEDVPVHIPGPRVVVELALGWALRAVAAYPAFEDCREVLNGCGLAVRFDGQTARIEGPWEEVFAVVRRCYEAAGTLNGLRLLAVIPPEGEIGEALAAEDKGMWLNRLAAGDTTSRRRPRRTEAHRPLRVERAVAALCATGQHAGGGDGDR